MKKYSETRKIKRERELRKQKSVNRRFNEPLKIFIQRKYNEIFQEYTELYNRMEEENPSRKDLCKSETFKEWLAANDGNVQSTMTLFTPQVALEPVPIANKALGDEASTPTQAPHESNPLDDRNVQSSPTIPLFTPQIALDNS